MMGTTDWFAFFATFIVDLPVLTLYIVLFLVGIWRQSKGEPGMLVSIAAVVWLLLAVVNKIYFYFLFPMIVQELDDPETFTNVSSFVMGLAYCAPLLILIFGWCPGGILSGPSHSPNTESQDENRGTRATRVLARIIVVFR